MPAGACGRLGWPAGFDLPHCPRAGFVAIMPAVFDHAWRIGMSYLKQVVVAVAAAVAVFMSVQAFAVSQAEKEAIAERIKPVGAVCMQGDTCASSSAAASGPRSGEEVYNASCMACHSTGAAGAPKLGDKAAWSARIAQG